MSCHENERTNLVANYKKMDKSVAYFSGMIAHLQKKSFWTFSAENTAVCKFRIIFSYDEFDKPVRYNDSGSNMFSLEIAKLRILWMLQNNPNSVYSKKYIKIFRSAISERGLIFGQMMIYDDNTDFRSWLRSKDQKVIQSAQQANI